MMPFTARERNPLKGSPTFSVGHRLYRTLWRLVWIFFAAWTPAPLHRWRVLILNLAGAKVHPTAHVYGSAHIWYPPHLRMAPYSCLGPKVNCYNMAPIRLGDKAIVSQGAHLCAGTHDIDDPNHQLITKPITVDEGAWIAAEAFIGPGVTVGAQAVVGARAVLMKDAKPYGVYIGNPAKWLRDRQFTQ